MLVRKESKPVWGFVSEESKPGLGLDSKLNMLQGLFIQAFLTLDCYNFDKLVSQSFRNREGIPHEDLFPAFRETEESQRAPPALAASRVILVQNY